MTARRYAAANQLSRLVTLTFASAVDREEALHACRLLLRRLRRLLGRPFPWISAPHRHLEHGWHVHLLLPRTVSIEAVDAAWADGFVHSAGWQRGQYQGRREQARAIAEYVLKELVSLGEQVPTGQHSYEVAQGFAVRVVRAATTGLREAIAIARSQFGCGWIRGWSSREIPSWRGPPAFGWLWP